MEVVIWLGFRGGRGRSGRDRWGWDARGVESGVGCVDEQVGSVDEQVGRAGIEARCVDDLVEGGLVEVGGVLVGGRVGLGVIGEPEGIGSGVR